MPPGAGWFLLVGSNPRDCGGGGAQHTHTGAYRKVSAAPSVLVPCIAAQKHTETDGGALTPLPEPTAPAKPDDATNVVQLRLPG
jgi:hypothetical protein